MRKLLNRKSPQVFLLCLMLMLGSCYLFAAEIVHHWTLDETDTAAGSQISDIVGGKNGTVNGSGIASQEGVVGTALYFDGASEVSIGGFSTANIKQMTMSFWIKPDTDTMPPPGYRRIFSAGDNWEAMINSNTGTIGNNFYRSGGTYPSSTEMPPEDEWTHVVMTSALSPPDSGRMEVYINGEFDAAEDGLAVDDWGGGTVLIAWRPGVGAGQHFKGTLDDIRIYDGVLTAEEIKAIYDSAFPGPEAVYPMPLPDPLGKNVPQDVTFQWTMSADADVEVDSYTIYMDTSEALVAEPNVPAKPMLIDGTGDASGILPAGEDAAASYAYSGLEKDTVYYWRIVADVWEPNALNPDVYDVPAVLAGQVWSFSSLTTGPAVYAGQNVLTWLEDGSAVIEPDATVTDETNDLDTILWSVVDPPDTTAVTFSPDSAAETEITIDAVGTYLLKLYADDLTGNTAEDTIEIKVFADSCEAAKNDPAGYTPPPYDFNDDCKQDMEDFAMFAQLWLQDNSLTEYIPYEKSEATSVPTVNITWPADGETISGGADPAVDPVRDPVGGGPINAVAYSVFDETMTDSTGILRVIFELIDAQGTVVASQTENIVTYDWANINTTQFEDGAYTLRATAIGDTQPPYEAVAEITVIIDNTP